MKRQKVKLVGFGIKFDKRSTQEGEYVLKLMKGILTDTKVSKNEIILESVQGNGFFVTYYLISQPG